MLPIRTILCPTDFSPASLTGVKAATELAAHFGAEICLSYVVPTIPVPSSDPVYDFELPEYEEVLHADAEKKLCALQGKMIEAKVSVRTMVGHGDAAGEIVLIAAKEHVDLIVIATHGWTGLRHLVFGSVAEKVVRLASCPVLTIRAPQAQG